MFSESNRFFRYFVLIIVVLAAGCNLAFLSTYNLHPDEAYFWVWSRHLAPSYFDNSPMVAYVIRLFTTIGHSEFWIRFPAFLSWLFFLGIVYFFTKKVYQNKNTAYLGVLITVFIPLVATGSHLMTTDIPMIFWAALVWYFLYMAVEEEKPNLWYTVGILFGLSLLAKLQSILILGAVCLMLLIRPSKRFWFSKKEPYWATLIGFAFFTPVLIWNSEHQWAMFKFSLQHGIHRTIEIQNLLEFWSGQLLVFSLLFIALVYYTIKNLLHWKELSNQDAFLIGCYLPIFGFFSLTSLTYTALANWPAVAYLPAIIFLAGQLNQSWQRFQPNKRRLMVILLSASFLISLFSLTLARYPGFFVNTLKIKLPKSVVSVNNNFYGWDELSQKIDDILIQKFPGRKSPVPVFCDGSYQTASELTFYLKSPANVFTIREARHNQFDYLLMENIRNFDHHSGILVLSKPLPRRAGFYFGAITPVKEISIQRFGREIRKFTVYYFNKLNAPALYKSALHKPLGYPGTYSD
jgi:4-amino-4-deoxy-L-arabinose transferase-like glycosyltransferase